MVVPVVASAFPSMMSIFCMVPPEADKQDAQPRCFHERVLMRGVMKRPPANPKKTARN